MYALYAQHVQQIDKLCRRLHEREVASNGRSVLTLEDLQAESFRLFRALLAAYDSDRAALSTYLQVSMRTRLMNLLRDSRTREGALDDALQEGETEPADESYQAPLPHDLDLSEVAEQIIENQPAKERARLHEIWDRLRNPV
jgi:DNA-directed RNA polymerase specialized sigma24 family protein